MTDFFETRARGGHRTVIRLDSIAHITQVGGVRWSITFIGGSEVVLDQREGEEFLAWLREQQLITTSKLL